MGGLHISCGTYHGEEKSGSAFTGVLEALEGVPEDLVDEIGSSFRSKDQATLTDVDVKLLLPLLRSYRERLVAELGHDDWWRAVKDEQAAGASPHAGKYGASKGWQLFCLKDLIPACEIALTEHQPVVIRYV